MLQANMLLRLAEQRAAIFGTIAQRDIRDKALGFCPVLSRQSALRRSGTKRDKRANVPLCPVSHGISLL
jgi:hypothetical protein